MKPSPKLKVSRPIFAFIIVLVNAANTYLVPLLGHYIPQADVPYVQGFLFLALNGLVVLLTTEMQQAPAQAPAQPAA